MRSGDSSMADVVDNQRLLSAEIREDSDETLLGSDEIFGRPLAPQFHLQSVLLDHPSHIPGQVVPVGPAMIQTRMNDVSLEGDITVPGAPEEEGEETEFNTLDEPVKDTILRDAKAIGQKFFHVLYPKESKALLQEWDWWGPLFLCVFLAMMLQGSTETANSMNDGGPQFAEVFVIYWVGAVVVTLNIKLLGGSISFFQSVCVLGYCVLPLTISLIICRLVLIAEPQTTALFAVRFITVLVMFAWSTFASTAFLAESQPSKRKALAMYPIFLFYFIISWLIISHTHH